MIALVQRVSQARVTLALRTVDQPGVKQALGRAVDRAVDQAVGKVVGEIAQGLLVLVCAEPSDTEVQAAKLVDKLLKLRIFSDTAGKMNRSVVDVSGGLLIVSQFTLAADVSGGNRPSFTGAASPEQGLRLYEAVLALARERYPKVQAGVFGADMQVSLINDGPVTIPMHIV